MRLSYDKSCTGGGGDPHPSAASEADHLEGTILRDADILEQLGAIGILRVAAKIGRDTRYPTFTDAAATLRKSLADLPGKLHLDIAKRLARPRIAILEAFLQELDKEAYGASVLKVVGRLVTDDVPSSNGCAWIVRD